MKKTRRILVLLVSVFFVVGLLAACGNSRSNVWPDSLLADQLPKPKFGDFELGFEISTDFVARIKESKPKDYIAYGSETVSNFV